MLNDPVPDTDDRIDHFPEVDETPLRCGESMVIYGDCEDGAEWLEIAHEFAVPMELWR